MKMKEQNVLLALASFFQVVFMATAATVISEMFKRDGNRYLQILATMTATGALIAGATIYLKVFIEARRHKK